MGHAQVSEPSLSIESQSELFISLNEGFQLHSELIVLSQQNFRMVSEGILLHQKLVRIRNQQLVATLDVLILGLSLSQVLLFLLEFSIDTCNFGRKLNIMLVSL